MKTLHTVFFAGMLLTGCSGSVRSLVSGDSDVDVDFALSKLAGLEGDTEYGLYEFMSNSRSDDNNVPMGICQGVLLMNDRGVCKFESPQRANSEPFWVYFDPAREIVVVFPSSKIAYRNSASLFQDPGAYRILAAYDGIRLVLGLSDVWSNPERNRLEKKRIGNRVEFQSPELPYRWEIELDASDSTAPFAELQAKIGRKNLTTVSRKSTSMALYDEAATREYGSGIEPRGVNIDVNLWQVEMEDGVRRNQIQFTPYPKSAIDRDRLGSQLESVELDKDYRIEELTLDRLKRWLDLK